MFGRFIRWRREIIYDKLINRRKSFREPSLLCQPLNIGGIARHNLLQFLTAIFSERNYSILTHSGKCPVNVKKYDDENQQIANKLERDGAKCRRVEPGMLTRRRR